jgi:peroxiredoxin
MSEQIPDPKPGRNPLVVIVGIIVLVSAIGLLIFGQDLFNADSDSNTATEPIPGIDPDKQSVAEIPAGRPGLQVGEVAPDFSLQDLDGNTVTLAQFRGQPVMINFWATWCGPCRVEMPEMQKAHDQYADEGFVILALNQDESAETVQSFYDELNLTFPSLLDDNSRVAADFGAFGVYPTSFFLDGAGQVTAVHRGPATLGQIEEYLELSLPQS